MTIKTTILDGEGRGTEVSVTSRNQLVVAPIDFSTSYNVTVDLVATGYNLVNPIANKQFVITDVILTANKNVGANDATVVLYEADADNSTVVSKSILNLEMKKNTSLALTSLNLIVSEGTWVNIKTDDDDIFATVMGYYVKA